MVHDSSPGTAGLTPVPVALIGAGRWGKTYLGLISRLPGVVVKVVCDPSSEALREAAALAPGCILQPSVQLCDLGACRGVIVATPPGQHTIPAMHALRAGVPVLVEKPFTYSVEDARAIQALALETGTPCLVGHQMLHHRAVERAIELLRDGVIGRIRTFETHRTSRPRAGDSPMWALGPHDVAFLRAAGFGQPVQIDTRREGDTLVAKLAFGGEVTARLTWSRHAATPTRTVVARGTDGTLILDEVAGHITLARAERAPERFEVPTMPPLERQLLHFLDCIRRTSTPISDATDGLEVVSILSAVEARCNAADRPAGPTSGPRLPGRLPTLP